MKTEKNNESENGESENEGSCGEEESECELSHTPVEISPLPQLITPLSIEPTLVPILERWWYLRMQALYNIDRSLNPSIGK